MNTDFTLLERAGMNVQPLVEGRTYTVNSLNGSNIVMPRRIRRECIDDYLDYCGRLVNPENKKELMKLEFARRVIEYDESLIPHEFLGCLSKYTRKDIKSIFGGQLDRGFRLGNLSESDRISLEASVLEELKIFLQSKETDERKDSLESVLDKFNPSVYEDAISTNNGMLRQSFRNLFPYASVGMVITSPFRLPSSLYYGYKHRKGNTFELELSRYPRKIQESVIAAGSCMKYAAIASFEHCLSDPGTIYFVAKRDNTVLGYARMFPMVDVENYKLVLALDTIEPPRMNSKKHIDLVNAMCLGAIQLMFDTNMHYVVSTHRMTKYGAETAFGNTERRMKLKKLGRNDVHSHTIVIYESSPIMRGFHVLMHNWKA